MEAMVFLGGGKVGKRQYATTPIKNTHTKPNQKKPLVGLLKFDTPPPLKQ